jgi:quaternary ammonium compound-resistance protein SugE
MIAMNWIYLFLAGILEVAWAVGMVYTVGWTKLVPSVLTLLAMAVGIYLLSVSIKTIPLGTAYAVWTGIGTVGTVVYGILFFKEPVDIIRVVCILLIIIGIVGLKLFSK